MLQRFKEDTYILLVFHNRCTNIGKHSVKRWMVQVNDGQMAVLDVAGDDAARQQGQGVAVDQRFFNALVAADDHERLDFQPVRADEMVEIFPCSRPDFARHPRLVLQLADRDFAFLR